MVKFTIDMDPNSLPESTRGAFARWKNIISIPLVDRFWNRVNKTESCWLWTGKPNPCGYGGIRVNRKRMLAHRVAWILTNGHIPDGMFVLHKCDVPACVRPDHLFVGTQKDNISDMMKKRRQPEGQEWGRSNLTDESILEIRRRYVPHSCTHEQLAKEYEVSIRTIGLIVNGKIWKHLPTKVLPHGRNVKSRGESHSRSTITESIVREIRKLRISGLTQIAISKQLEIGEGVVRAICLGKTWKHVV